MKYLFLLFACYFFSSQLMAQGSVGINNDNSAPDASAMLDVNSNSKGMLIPRMTESERGGIASPATGLLIYQTDVSPGFYVYNGTEWTAVGGGGASQWAVNGDDIYNSNSGRVSIGTNAVGNASLLVSGTDTIVGYDTLSYTFYANDAGNFSGMTTGEFSVFSTGVINSFGNDADINLKHIDSFSQVLATVKLSGNVEGGFGFAVDPVIFLDNLSDSDAANANPPLFAGFSAIGGTNSCGVPSDPSASYFATSIVDQDITASISMDSIYRFYLEDFGGSGFSGNFCGSPNLWAELTIKIIIPVKEAALIVEEGSIRLKDFEGGNNFTGIYIDRRGELKQARGNGPLLVSHGDSMVMSNYIPSKLVVGASFNYLSVLPDSIDYGGGAGMRKTTPATIEILGSGNRPIYGANIREYDSTGVTRIHSNGHVHILDPISIYANGNIAGGNFFAHSDERIKHVIGQSNKENDLDVLDQIRITDYTHIDTVMRGTGTVKKVLAQELRSVYPIATKVVTRAIPDIYTYGKIEEDWIYCDKHVDVGDQLELRRAEGDKEQIDHVLVLEVQDGKFRIDRPLNDQYTFIYGRIVDDFHMVDYDALTTLNVSATQALLRRIEALEGENESLKEQVNEVAVLKSEMQQIKHMLGVVAGHE